MNANLGLQQFQAAGVETYFPTIVTSTRKSMQV